MKTIPAVFWLLATSGIAFGQVVPSASSGRAELGYSIRYSEIANFGGTLGDWHTITPSGSLTYINGHSRFPFSLEYAGGYTATLSGEPYSTGVFQRLFLSEELHYHKWTFGVGDDVSYRPQSPTTGFSGIPGTGEPIGSGTSGSPNQFILTLDTYALENVSRGEVEHLLNFRTTLDIEASFDYLHYPDGNGLDTNSANLRGGIDVRLNARNSLAMLYKLSRFSYPGYDFDTITNTAMLGFRKTLTRALQINAAAGPEWVSSSRNVIVPASTGVGVQADMEYERRRTTAMLSYLRGTYGGSGYMIGSQSDVATASLSREVNQEIGFAMSGGFNHNSSLQGKGAVFTTFAGTQASWQIGRNLNAFVSYTATSQNSGMQLPSNVQQGVIHQISCGIGLVRKTKRAQ